MSSSLNACDFIAGWVGGAAGVLASHPLDTVKVRLQTSSTYNNTMECFTKTLRSEGVRGFYKGMSFPLFSVAAYNALVFGVYSNTTRLVCQSRHNDPNHTASYTDMCVGAMVAGGVSVLIGSPVDLVKIRLQAQTGNSEKAHLMQLTRTTSNMLHRLKPNIRWATSSHPWGKLVPCKANRANLSSGRKCTIRNARSEEKCDRIPFHGRLLLDPNVKCLSSTVNSFRSTALLSTQLLGKPVGKQLYEGPIDCIVSIFKESGLKGFYRSGGLAMVVRDVPGYVVYFLPYAVLCKVFSHEGESNVGALGLVMAGGLAGVLSWGAMHPVDTVKSRLQLNAAKYKGILDCIYTGYRNEGVSVFFRGLTVNAIRGFPQSAALFFGYEMSLRVMQKS